MAAIGGRFRESTDVDTTPSLRERCAHKHAERCLRKYNENIAQARHGARIFHCITSTLITPIEMSMGAARFVRACTTFVTTSLTGRMLPKRDPTTFSWIAKEVKIAFLQMIPIVGAQLANQYRMYSTLEGFSNAPAFGGLLAKLGPIISKMLYGNRKKDSLPEYDGGGNRIGSCEYLYATLFYLRIQRPEISDVIHHLSGTSSLRCLVRIPVKKNETIVRYHDGTLLMANDLKREKNKTVVLYHAQNQHRHDNEKKARMYLKRGYNVLLASYAGDTVVTTTRWGVKMKRTKCAEYLMREDALADVEFFKELGITQLAVHGIFLGAAQAMNFAQALQNQNAELSLDFVLLEKPFTSIVEATANDIRNGFNSELLAQIISDLTKKILFAETNDPASYGCDGLNNENKLRELSQDPRFDRTKFYIIGMIQDVVNGTPPPPDTNFSLRLKRAAHDQTRARLDMQQSNHHSPCKLTQAKRFLLPPKEKNALRSKYTLNPRR